MINRVLKVLFIAILLFALIITVSYCIKKTKYSNNHINKVYTFSGVVDEINTTSIIVVPNEDEEILKSSDRIQIDTINLDFHRGDSVTINYKGDIKETYPSKVNAVSIIKNEYSKIVKLYLTAIDYIMNEDEGLNEEIEYLSIDTDSFVTYPKNDEKLSNYPKISTVDETKILSYCMKYNKDIRQSSLNELKSQGLFDEETMTLSGMVIYIKDIKEFTEDRVKFTIVKYIGGQGALFAEYTLEYDENSWQITDSAYAIS